MKKYIFVIPCLIFHLAWGQTTYQINQLIDSALINNKLLQIKSYQIKEKQAELSAMNQLRLPNLTLGGSYMYNFTPLRLQMDAGSLGSIPIPGLPISIPLPMEDVNEVIGNKQNIIAGGILAVPLTQQFKINNGSNVKKIEVRIIETEQQQTANKIKHAVEQLYLGINASRWALEALDAKIELAQEELNYIQTAIESEKAIPTNYYGLKAALADEKQQRLKKYAELMNLLNKLNHLTQLNLLIEQISDEAITIAKENTLQNYISLAQSNPDYQMAVLTQQKASQGVNAAKNSYIPDLSLVGGYMYQYGIDYINSNFAMVGVNLKWSINDVFKNKKEQNQREAQYEQARLFAENTQAEIERNITAAYNEMMVAKDLVDVAGEALEYRTRNYQSHQERYDAGLINKKELVKIKQEFIKVKSDFYAAQLNYQVHLSRLQELTGN